MIRSIINKAIPGKTIRASGIALLAIALMLLFSACGGSTELQAGERYFEGDIDFEYAESSTISYILLSDGSGIRNVNVVMKNVDIAADYKDFGYSGSIREKVGTKSMSFGKGKPDGEGFLQLGASDTGVRFNFAPDGVSGELFYTVTEKIDDSYTAEVFLGTFRFTMVDRTDSL